MNESLWYLELIRPTWAPPSWIFGPVWSCLYLIIAITFGYIGYAYMKKKIPRAVALPFALNLISNALFTPIQFGLQNNFLAAIDISIILITIIWMFRAVYVFDKKQSRMHPSTVDVYRDRCIAIAGSIATTCLRLFPRLKKHVPMRTRIGLVLQRAERHAPKGYMWIVYANIPYLLWVSFATVLQFTITYLNW